MIEFIHQEGPENVVAARMSGKVTREDYQQFNEKCEAAIEKVGKITVMFEMVDAHWGVGAAWEDVKFEWKHGKDISRCAIVGDRRWEEVMTKLWQPVFPAEMRYFDEAQRDEAWNWLTESS